MKGKTTWQFHLAKCVKVLLGDRLSPPSPMLCGISSGFRLYLEDHQPAPVNFQEPINTTSAKSGTKCYWLNRDRQSLLIILICSFLLVMWYSLSSYSNAQEIKYCRKPIQPMTRNRALLHFYLVSKTVRIKVKIQFQRLDNIGRLSWSSENCR